MKDDLRYKLKVKRKYFSGVRRQYADEIIRRYFLAAYGGCFDSFFIYYSFGSEADTHGIIDELLSRGKRVYLPRVEGEEIVAAPYGKLRKGAFGLEEPQGRAYYGDIDVVAVPLLAVNPQGYRIGYGKGFYDGYLKGKTALKVGLGYSFQQEEFQADAWDEPLDIFLNEKGIVSYGQGQAR